MYVNIIFLYEAKSRNVGNYFSFVMGKVMNIPLMSNIVVVWYVKLYNWFSLYLSFLFVNNDTAL